MIYFSDTERGVYCVYLVGRTCDDFHIRPSWFLEGHVVASLDADRLYYVRRCLHCSGSVFGFSLTPRSSMGRTLGLSILGPRFESVSGHHF